MPEIRSMSPSPLPVVVVGAGLAGLACAARLAEAGRAVRVIEADDRPGGRVRSDRVDGFLLDRGFQVYLDAYPRAGGLLDLAALDLHPFEPGARVWFDGRLHRVMDVFRRPGALLESARSPVGTILDKLRVAQLRRRVRRSDPAAIARRRERGTATFLEEFGFSPGMIERFFRPFYGGVFLERELRTSSRLFEFTFKMFAEGSATLPAKGMEEIPRQLAARLPEGALQCGRRASAVAADRVTLEDGESLAASAVVLATDADAARTLLPGAFEHEPVWRGTRNLYFAAPESPLGEPIIALNGSGHGVVNSVCTPSDVAAGYAPAGQALVSVALIDGGPTEGLDDRVRDELFAWFGPQVRRWRHLRSDRIDRALPDEPPGVTRPLARHQGVHLCGDHRGGASIEGAIGSGLDVAAALLGD